MEVKMSEFNAINGNIEAVYHMAAKKLGLSDTELNVMYILCDVGEGCPQSALYKKSGMGKSTVNSAVKKMEREGIIELKSGGGRDTFVYFTDKGRNKASETVEKLIEIENEVYDVWSVEEKKQFMELNSQFMERMQAAVLNRL